MDSIPSLIILVIFLFIGVVALWCRDGEKKAWNNGVSRKSGLKWILFDVDSQGSRMYRDGAGNYCSISYSVDECG